MNSATNFLLLPLLLLLVATAAADVSQPQPAGECYCITDRFVNIRDAACGEVIGDSQLGYSFTSLGGRAEACGIEWFNLSFNNSAAWVGGQFIEACPKQRCEVQCPKIVSRIEWGARDPLRTQLISRPVKYMFVHSTGSARCSNMADCAAQLRDLQNLQMNTMGYRDIAYSFMISNDGTIYEGTGWYRTGDHTGEFGDDGLAFAFIGDYTSELPTVAAQRAARELLFCGELAVHLHKHYALRAHKDMLPVSDPGLPIYNMIRRWPHY